MPKPSQTTTHRWRYENTPMRLEADAAKSSSRRRWIGIVLLVILIGGLIGVLLVPKPQPRVALVAFGATRYEHLPHNPFAKQDHTALASHLTEPSDPGVRQEKEGFAKQLEELTRLPNGTTAVVVSISGYAVVDDAGHVMLLPANVRPDLPADERNDLAKVFNGIRECPVRKRLVLIDLRSPPAEPLLGRIPTDLAGALRKQVTEAQLDAFVLTARGENERSVVSQVLDHSVFGYFVNKGLAGGARVDQNLTIGARELGDYVKKQVPDWVMRNYQASQQPAILAEPADGKDFALVVHRSDSSAEIHDGVVSEETAVAPHARVYPAWLAEAWNHLATWRAGPGYQLYPVQWRRMQDRLFFAERDWLGGGDNEAALQAEFNRLRNDFPGRKAAVEPSRAAENKPPHSLALTKKLAELLRAEKPVQARAAGYPGTTGEAAVAKDAVAPTSSPAARTNSWQNWQPPEDGGDLRRWLEDKLNDLDDKGGKLTVSDLAKQLKADDKFVAMMKRDNAFLDLAWAAMQVKPRVAARHPQLAVLYGLVALHAEDAPTFVETIWLGRLAKLAEASTGWPQELVDKSLSLVNLAERVTAEWQTLGFDLQALQPAAQARHDFEALLLARGYAGNDKALASWAIANSAYEQLEAGAAQWEKARRAVDDALDVLRFGGTTLAGADRETQHTLTSAVESLANVEAALRRAERKPVGWRNPDADDLAKLEKLVESSQQRAVDQLVTAAARKDQRVPLTLRQLESALESPLPLTGRRELWLAAHALAVELNGKDKANAGAKPVPFPVPDAQAQREFADRYAAQLESLTVREPGAERTDRSKRWEALVKDSQQLLATGNANDVAQARTLLKALPLAKLPAADPQPDALRTWSKNNADQAARWVAARLFYEARDAADDGAGEKYESVAKSLDEAAASDVPRLIVQPLAANPAPGQPGRLIVTLENLASKPLKVEHEHVKEQDFDLEFAAEREELTQCATGKPTQMNFLLRAPARVVPRETRKGALLRLKVGDWTFHSRVTAAPVLTKVNDELDVFFTASADVKSAGASATLELQPRATPAQAFFLFVRNPGEERKKVSFAVMEGDKTVATATALAVQTGVTHVPLTPRDVGPDAGKVTGRLTVQIVEEGKSEKRHPIGLTPLHPKSYVDVEARNPQNDRESGRLEVALRADDPLIGSCQVKLVLPGAYFNAGGRPTVTLSRDKPSHVFELPLDALRAGVQETAYCFIDVDQWPRAFTFKVERRSGRIQIDKVSRPVLLLAPTAFAKRDKEKYKFEVLPDYALSDVEFGVGLTKPNVNPGQREIAYLIPEETRDLAKLRQLRVQSVDGGLAISLKWEPWHLEWDLPPKESRGLVRAVARRPGATEPTGEPAVALVLFDETSPVIVEWKPTTSALPKQELTYSAKVEDPESGVDKVQFAIAKLGDAKNPDLNWVDAKLEDGRYVAKALAPEKLGTYHSVLRVANKLGLADVKSVDLEVTNQPTGPALVTGIITRGERKVVAEVTLTPTPTSTEGTTYHKFSDANGVFEIRDVKPGKYVLFAKDDNAVRDYEVKKEVVIKANVLNDLGTLQLTDPKTR